MKKCLENDPTCKSFGKILDRSSGSEDTKVRMCTLCRHSQFDTRRRRDSELTIIQLYS